MLLRHLHEDIQKINAIRDTISALSNVTTQAGAINIIRATGAVQLEDRGLAGGRRTPGGSEQQSLVFRSKNGPYIAKIYPQNDDSFTTYYNLCKSQAGKNVHLLRLAGDLIEVFDEKHNFNFNISFAEYVTPFTEVTRTNASYFYPFMYADGPDGPDFYAGGRQLSELVDLYWISVGDRVTRELTELFERRPTFKKFCATAYNHAVKGRSLQCDLHAGNVGFRSNGEMVVIDAFR